MEIGVERADEIIGRGVEDIKCLHILMPDRIGGIFFEADIEELREMGEDAVENVFQREVWPQILRREFEITLLQFFGVIGDIPWLQCIVQSAVTGEVL